MQRPSASAGLTPVSSDYLIHPEDVEVLDTDDSRRAGGLATVYMGVVISSGVDKDSRRKVAVKVPRRGDPDITRLEKVSDDGARGSAAVFLKKRCRCQHTQCRDL